MTTGELNSVAAEVAEWEAVMALCRQTCKDRDEANLKLGHWLMYLDLNGRLQESWADPKAVELMDAFRRQFRAYESAYGIKQKMYQALDARAATGG